MSLPKDIRNKLSEAPASMKKLDQLVRQGMMSPAALPMLHRGLDKLNAGKVLNPQEREAVNKVLQSMLYIVTGDDTVFQRARQHTQRTKYQTEETSLDEGDYAVVSTNGSMITNKSKVHGYVKTMPKGKNLDKLLDKHGADRVIHRDKLKTSNVSEDEEYDNEGEMAKKQLTTLADAAQELMGMLSDNQNLPEWVQSKITKATDYLDTARDYMKSEGDDGKAPVGEEVMSESYKAKFAAMLKKTGKSLKDMSDDEKKAFFNKVDAAHDAKNEGKDYLETDMKKRQKNNEKAREGMKKMAPPMKNPALGEGAMSRIDYQQKSGEKGSGLETFKKKPAAKDTLVASPKTQRVKRTTAKAAERMVKKGAVYAEDAVEEGYKDSEDMRAKAERKAARTAKKVASREKATDPGIKEGYADEHIKENRALRDARRAMRSDPVLGKRSKKEKSTTYKGTKAGEERHGGHIIMQLRKAVSIGKPVKFKDGSEHKVSKADAHKFMMKYNSSKPADREKMHSGHDSHDSFQSHINK